MVEAAFRRFHSVLPALGLLIFSVPLLSCQDRAAGARCGNGVAEGEELCDGPDLDGKTCENIGGYVGGTLACNDTCDGFDESGCIATRCGNGVAEGEELCDGTDLDGKTCENIGGSVGGTLTCNDTCDGFDESGCIPDPCGNGVIDAGEQCDGTDLADQDCVSIGQGFGCGTLSCKSNCRWNTSECLVADGTCGNGVAENCEVCDGTDLGGMDCSDYGYPKGNLYCSPDCKSHLIHRCYTDDPWTCGDGVKQPNESCDGSDLDGHTCENIGFSGGSLSCSSVCHPDVSQCIGDYCALMGYYDDGWCDACELLGGHPDDDCNQECFTSNGRCRSWYNFFSDLSTCQLTKGVEDPDCVCGDGILDPNHHEECDGTEFQYASCHEFYEGFDGGTLLCSPNCHIDSRLCTSSETSEATCDDGIDNDVDGPTDCADPDCDGRPCGKGTCSSGICQ